MIAGECGRHISAQTLKKYLQCKSECTHKRNIPASDQEFVFHASTGIPLNVIHIVCRENSVLVKVDALSIASRNTLNHCETESELRLRYFQIEYDLFAGCVCKPNSINLTIKATGVIAQVRQRADI